MLYMLSTLNTWTMSNTIFIQNIHRVIFPIYYSLPSLGPNILFRVQILDLICYLPEHITESRIPSTVLYRRVTHLPKSLSRCLCCQLVNMGIHQNTLFPVYPNFLILKKRKLTYKITFLSLHVSIRVCPSVYLLIFVRKFMRPFCSLCVSP
jgi:hypothetical protein